MLTLGPGLKLQKIDSEALRARISLLRQLAPCTKTVEANS